MTETTTPRPDADMDLDALTADLDNEAMGALDEDAVHFIVRSLAAEVRRLRGVRDDLRAQLAAVASLPCLRPEPDEDPSGYGGYPDSGHDYSAADGRTRGRNDLREEFLDELADLLKPSGAETEEPSR